MMSSMTSLLCTAGVSRHIAGTASFGGRLTKKNPLLLPYYICTTCRYRFYCVMLKPYALRLPTATATAGVTACLRVRRVGEHYYCCSNDSRTVLCGALYTACVDTSRTVFWDRSQALVLRLHLIIDFGHLGIVHAFERIPFVFLHLNFQHLPHRLFYTYFVFNLHLRSLRGSRSDQYNDFSKNGVFPQWVPAFKLSGTFPPNTDPDLGPCPFVQPACFKFASWTPFERHLQVTTLNQWERLRLVF